MSGAIQAVQNKIILEANLNAKAARSRFEHLTSWLKDVGGAVSCYQALEKTLKLAAHAFRAIGDKSAIFCERLAGKIFAVYSGLCLTRIPETVQKAYQTIFRPKNILTSRDGADAVNTIADAGATLGYSGMFVAGNPAALAVAEGFSLAGTVTDLYMKSYDVKQANALLGEIDPKDSDLAPVKEMLEDTRTHCFLKIAKAVASLACTILGAALVSVGGSHLYAVALLSIGLAGTVTGIAAGFFKDSRRYELADFSQPVALPSAN